MKTKTCLHYLTLKALLLGSVFVVTTVSVTRALGEPVSAAATQADQDYQFFKDGCRVPRTKKTSEMLIREQAEYYESRALMIKERGLQFLEKYPTDPRRWDVVAWLESSKPQYVREWRMRDGREPEAVIDEAAVAEWDRRVDGMMAKLAMATDVPLDVLQGLARNRKRREQDLLFPQLAVGGRTAPDFLLAVTDLSGNEIKLSDYLGKVVIIDFWATWCGPCLASLPHIQEMAARYKDQGVVVLSVCTMDTRDKFDTWIGKNREKFADITFVFDRNGTSEDHIAANLYGAPGIPYYFVVRRDGVIADAVVGYAEGEVILDGALAKAGVRVDPPILELARIQLEKRPQAQPHRIPINRATP